MQNFFEQVKVCLADHVTYFSATQPNCVYFELEYRDNKVEIDYDALSEGNLLIPTSTTFILSLDLGSDFELEILPKSFFDRLFDVQADISPFDASKKIRFKIPLLQEEVALHTNNEGVATSFLALPDVGQVVCDYGITFFKVDNGELKIYLNDLSSEKFQELKSTPSLITKYLDILIDLSSHLKTK